MCAKKTGSLEDLAVVGIDIGKDTFHLVGFDRSGQLFCASISSGSRWTPRSTSCRDAWSGWKPV